VGVGVGVCTVVEGAEGTWTWLGLLWERGVWGPVGG